MDENLYILTNRLLENKDIAKKFLDNSSPDEFYNFSKLLKDGYSKEEFDDYMIELSKLNLLLDDSHINDDDLKDISGGLIWNRSWNKIISKIICTSMIFSPQLVSASENFINYNSHIAGISQKENRNYIWDSIKNFVSKNKNSILLGSSAAFIIQGAIVYVNMKYNNPSLEGMRGLHNVGNSCYLNSAIQQLYRIDYFRNIILSQEGVSSLSHPITYSMKEIFLSMLKNEPIGEDRMREFAAILGHDFEQGDSILKMMWIICECERELKINSILSLNTGISLYRCHPGDNLVKIIKDQADVDWGAFKEYMVNNIPGMAGLPEKVFEQKVTDFIEKNDVSNFGKIDIKTNFGKIDIKTNFGNNILIPIYRPTDAQKRKISINIDIPTFIDAQNDFNIENGGRYYLSGVTIHHGEDNSGHYFVYEQLPNGKWIKISDNWVSGELDYFEIKEDIEKNSTLLVYSAARG